VEVLYVDSASAAKRVSVGRTGADVVTVATSVAAVLRDDESEDVAGMVKGKGKLLGR
jgi:hypothetical protein